MSRRNSSEWDVTASVDTFSTAILEALEGYSREVAVVAKEAVEETAEECRQEISQKSPGSGPYGQSWKKKQAYYSHDEVRYTIYNDKHYQLTHLLEYGHEKWLWGDYTGERVKAIPHIRPAEEKAEQNLINKIKRGLS